MTNDYLLLMLKFVGFNTITSNGKRITLN